MKNKGIIYIVTAFLLAVAAVFLYLEIGLQSKVPLRVVVSMDGREEQITCWEKQQGEYVIYLPSGISMSQVCIEVDTTSTVLIGNIQVHSGMSCEAWMTGTSYTLSYTYLGRKWQKNVTFLAMSGVSMYIDTESGSIGQIHSSQNHREEGTLRLYNVDGRNVYEGSLDSFGGRGNSTWTGHEKKPYSFKLSAQADLLGMGSAQKWILLANAVDMTHIRNRFVLDFAADAGLAYTPQSQWVDLYINGEYRGLYLLCERNEIHAQRVDISAEQGVLVCMDRESKLMGEPDPYVVTENGQAFGLVDTTVETERVQALLQSVENAIMAEDGIDPVTGKNWQELIDIDSWARKYLVEELFGNMDAGCQSQYYYCNLSNGDQRLYAGPVWDYDLSMGTLWMMRNPQTLFADRLEARADTYTPWLYFLCRKVDFADYVARIYETEFMPLLERYLTKTVPGYFAQMSGSIVADWRRWDIPPEAGLAEYSMVQDYMAERMNFLKYYLLEKNDYCVIQVDSDTGVYLVYYMVEPGETLSELELVVDNSSGTFQGWCYTDTDTPVDMETPIYEDIAIKARWGIPLWLRMIESVLALGVCTLILVIFFFGMLGTEIRRGLRNR